MSNGGIDIACSGSPSSWTRHMLLRVICVHAAAIFGLRHPCLWCAPILLASAFDPRTLAAVRLVEYDQYSALCGVSCA